jgi:hypothetical protein
VRALHVALLTRAPSSETREAMTLDKELEALGATRATDVTLSPLRPHSSADAATAAASAHTLRTATSAGACIARCGGRELRVEWWQADALVKAGAKDERE